MNSFYCVSFPSFLKLSYSISPCHRKTENENYKRKKANVYFHNRRGMNVFQRGRGLVNNISSNERIRESFIFRSVWFRHAYTHHAKLQQYLCQTTCGLYRSLLFLAPLKHYIGMRPFKYHNVFSWQSHSAIKNIIAIIRYCFGRQ